MEHSTSLFEHNTVHSSDDELNQLPKVSCFGPRFGKHGGLRLGRIFPHGTRDVSPASAVNFPSYAKMSEHILSL
jgi:hypothetical protein